MGFRFFFSLSLNLQRQQRETICRLRMFLIFNMAMAGEM